MNLIDQAKFRIKYSFRVVPVIITIMILEFALMSFARYFMSNQYGSQMNALIAFGANSWILVSRGEYYRLLTATFLHVNIFHLAVNVFSFHSLGRFIEDRYGAGKLILIFVITGIVSSLTSNFIAYHSGTLVVSAGVSGVVFGFAGVILGNKLRPNTYSYGLNIDYGRLTSIILLNLFLGFAIPGIDNSAHIGGLLAGLLLGYIIDPINSFHPSKTKKLIVKYLEIVAIILIPLSFLLLILDSV